MKKNIGKFDFYIRLIIALICGYLAYELDFTDWKSYVFSALSILMIFTATLRFCPLYYLINTNSFKIDL